MQNLSTMNCTMWGGSTFMWGCMPIVSNSLKKGSHQLISVFVVTPAQSASCCFVIAFITFSISPFTSYILLLTSKFKTFSRVRTGTILGFRVHVRTREESFLKVVRNLRILIIRLLGLCATQGQLASQGRKGSACGL